MAEGMTSLEERMNTTERDSKKTFLKVIGIPHLLENTLKKFPHKNGYMIDLMRNCCEKLKFDHFSLANIVSSHVVKTPGALSATDSLVLEFSSERHKLNLYSQRVKFRDHKDKIFLNEI